MNTLDMMIEPIPYTLKSQHIHDLAAMGAFQIEILLDKIDKNESSDISKPYRHQIELIHTNLINLHACKNYDEMWKLVNSTYNIILSLPKGLWKYFLHTFNCVLCMFGLLAQQVVNISFDPQG